MPNERGRFGHGWQRKRLAWLSLLLPALTLRPETLTLPVGVLLGRWFNPDQDAWNKIGKLEGILLLNTYRKAIPHRGRASHTIGISGLFLFAPVVLVIIITAWATGLIKSPYFWPSLFWLTWGVTLDNAMHIIADKIESAWKKTILGQGRKR